MRGSASISAASAEPRAPASGGRNSGREHRAKARGEKEKIMLNHRILFSAVAVGLAGIACGDSDGGNGGDNGGSDGLSIRSFEVSSSSVRSGQTVTLTWDVRGATFLEVRQGEVGRDETTLVEEEDEAASGSGQAESNPIANETTFTLIAANAEEQLEETQTVTVQGIRIVEFSADPSSGIRSGDVVELSWVIEGSNVESLELTDEDGNTPLGADDEPVDLLVANTGTVEIKVLGDVGSDTDTETFTLRAVGGGGSATETLELEVEVALPIIDRFATTAGTNTFVFGRTVTAEWRVRNAERVIIKFDGNICANTTDFDNETNNRSACTSFTVQNPTHTLSIEVVNANTPTPDDYVTEEITITGTDPVVVDSFSVDPATYWQGASEVTFTWETSVANRAELQQRVSLGGGQFDWCTITETPKAGCLEFPVTAPTSPDGTFTFEVVGAEQRNFRIRAILEADGQVVDDENLSALVAGDFDEPDSSQASPLLINTRNLGLNQRGTITDPGEEDWFAVDVPENGRVFARASVETFAAFGEDPQAACFSGDDILTDTRIELFDPSGNSLGSSGSNALAAFGGDDNTCATVVGHLQPFAVDLPAGRYSFKVTGEESRTGQYTFAVDVFEPAVEPQTSITAVGGPQWQVVDINVSAVPLFLSALTYPLANHGLVPNGMNALFRQSAVFVSGAPHDRDYATELEPALQAMGVKLNTGFAPIDLGIGTPMGDVPNGLMLTYTVVPTGDTSTTTFDYRPLGEAEGPALPIDIFPLTTEEQFFGKVFEDPLFDENVNPMNGDPIDGLAYPVFEDADRADVVEGVSHRHFLHLNSVGLNTEEPDVAAGTYIWVVHIFDDTGGGYEIEVSFDIN